MPEHRDLRSLAVGDEVDAVYRLKHLVARQTQQGKDFLLGEVQDRSGVLGFVWWHAKGPVVQELQQATYARMVGTINRHKERLQLAVSRISPVADDEVDPDLYRPAGEVDVARLWAECEAVIAGLEDPWIRQLLQSIFADESIANRFREAPAAVTMHHAWRHGLLEHTMNVVGLAQDMADRYPLLDRSLLIAGALLHDLCKIDELSWDGQLDYTTPGNLVGHIVLGAALVDRISRAIPDFPVRTREKVQHLILSHHGEWPMAPPASR